MSAWGFTYLFYIAGDLSYVYHENCICMCYFSMNHAQIKTECSIDQSVFGTVYPCSYLLPMSNGLLIMQWFGVG